MHALPNPRPEDDELARLHAVVEGSVQGVGFRMYVLDQADALGLSGWVRNTHAGQVEVLAEGGYAALDRLLDLLRRGPRAAFVTEVSQEWLPATGEFDTFSVRPTV